MHYTFYPRGVCSTSIELDVTGGCVHNIVYANGCSGNLKAIAVLAEGMPAEQLIQKLKGIRCGGNSTSCGDQLATLLERALHAGE